MRSKWDIREILQKNAVTVMFVVLCIIGLICSGQTVSYVMYELFGRLSRNAFIVLALIIPIVASLRMSQPFISVLSRNRAAISSGMPYCALRFRCCH